MRLTAAALKHCLAASGPVVIGHRKGTSAQVQVPCGSAAQGLPNCWSTTGRYCSVRGVVWFASLKDSCAIALHTFTRQSPQDDSNTDVCQTDENTYNIGQGAEPSVEADQADAPFSRCSLPTLPLTPLMLPTQRSKINGARQMLSSQPCTRPLHLLYQLDSCIQSDVLSDTLALSWFR
jgi:hypothetical protein